MAKITGWKLCEGISKKNDKPYTFIEIYFDNEYTLRHFPKDDAEAFVLKMSAEV